MIIPVSQLWAQECACYMISFYSGNEGEETHMLPHQTNHLNPQRIKGIDHS